MADRELRMAGGVDISGPDVEAAVAEVEEPDGMDARLSNFWFQMLFDVMRKAPNPRSCVLPSYMDMKPIECTQIEEDFFKTFELPFRQVRYKVVEFDYWQNTMFNRFFPPRSSVLPPNLQNFPSCQYFKDYTALMGHVTKADSVEIRNALRERWNRLYWLPITGYDRMWVTRTTMSGHHVTLPDGYNRSAPQIAFNPLYFKHGETLVTLRGAVDQYPE
ncbi:hypothetical protein FOMPIDRAFT_1056731 [Fomitopsis schrenkii]|uniref:Uncharacterized protein n=1 Tax=Fomitopsis schrenkii TaxID=2126942 RepID=S8DML5_FOMSC|nr:hypothetical protein FOMPIDRAFT_1056731 [Fomitopsis schrenkii]